MSFKFKSLVLFIKIVTRLLLLRPFGNLKRDIYNDSFPSSELITFNFDKNSPFLKNFNFMLFSFM